MPNSNGIGLAELLFQLRGELDKAQEKLRTSGEAPAIDWESAEVEISFGVAKEAKAEGGVDFYVFSIGGGGKYKSEQVHRLKLQLKPHTGSKPTNMSFSDSVLKQDLGKAVAKIPGASPLGKGEA
jgi:hypothetical protein